MYQYRQQRDIGEGQQRGVGFEVETTFRYRQERQRAERGINDSGGLKQHRGAATEGRNIRYEKADSDRRERDGQAVVVEIAEKLPVLALDRGLAFGAAGPCFHYFPFLSAVGSCAVVVP